MTQKKGEDASKEVLQGTLLFSDDESFLQVLRVPVEQHPDEATVVAGIRSFLANRCGYFEAVGKIISKMEQAADTMKRPIDGQRYAQLHEMIVRRNYAEVLSAIGSSNASKFINQDRRKALLNRVENVLLPALGEFHSAASSYREELLHNLSGGGLVAMVPGILDQMPAETKAALLSVPRSNNIINAAELFVDRVNETFSGFGEAAARVMAQDAIQFKKALESDDLPRFTGHLDREQMLKSIGADVTASDVQNEQDLAVYAVLILRLKNPAYAARRSELLAAIWEIDSNISWS